MIFPEDARTSHHYMEEGYLNESLAEAARKAFFKSFIIDHHYNFKQQKSDTRAPDRYGSRFRLLGAFVK
jgi:hypothetical protein